jgi:hypothetical protein
MKLMTTLISAAAIAALGTAGCKNAEKKTATSAKPAAGDEPAGAEPGAAGDPAAANPHVQPANPHGSLGTQSPHGGGMAGGGGGAITAGPTAEDGTKTMGPVTLKIPKAWKESPPSSGMRVGQFTIDGAGGPAELIVYYFGGGGGSVDANLDRWYGQFEQPDGSPSKAKATREDRQIDGLDVTTVDVSGKFVAAVSPAAPQGPKHDKPDHQMLAAIIQTSQGPLFFKMVGPRKTVTATKGDWDDMVASISKTK